jgi:hypothetical protein
VATGQAAAGAGDAVARVRDTFWFAWAAFQPETRLIGAR